MQSDRLHFSFLGGSDAVEGVFGDGRDRLKALVGPKDAPEEL